MESNSISWCKRNWTRLRC